MSISPATNSRNAARWRATQNGSDSLSATRLPAPCAMAAAFRKAAAIAHGAGKRVALSLSDPFCVARHRAAFRELVAGEIDILFANEAEICSLYETEDFDVAAAAVRGHVAIAALTRSAAGSVILADGAMHHVAAAPITRV